MKALPVNGFQKIFTFVQKTFCCKLITLIFALPNAEAGGDK